MKLFLEISLLGSFLLLITALILVEADAKKRRAYTLFGTIGLNLILLTVVFTWAPTTSGKSLLTENKSSSALAEGKLQVKLRTVPATFETTNYNGKMSLQLVVTNNSKADLPDLRLTFPKGKLTDHYYLADHKGKNSFELLDDTIALGDLEVGQNKKIQIELIPKTDSPEAKESLAVGDDKNLDKLVTIMSSVTNLKPLLETAKENDPEFKDFKPLEPASKEVTKKEATEEEVAKEEEIPKEEATNEEVTNEEVSASLNKEAHEKDEATVKEEVYQTPYKEETANKQQQPTKN